MKGKSLDEFRTVHDRQLVMKNRLQAGLKELDDSWEYVSEFLRRCRIPQNYWGELMGSVQDHIVVTPASKSSGLTRRWAIAGTKTFAAKLRAQLAK